MLNKYPLWKYLLVLMVVLLGLFYAAPNLYAPDPALQIAGESSAQLVDERALKRALTALEEAGIEHFGEVIDDEGRTALVRLGDPEQQLKAQAEVSGARRALRWISKRVGCATGRDQSMSSHSQWPVIIDPVELGCTTLCSTRMFVNRAPRGTMSSHRRGT